jgi:hypothetical protein
MAELSPKKLRVEGLEDVIKYFTKGLKDFSVFVGSLDELERGHGTVFIVAGDKTITVKLKRWRVVSTKIKTKDFVKRRRYL